MTLPTVAHGFRWPALGAAWADRPFPVNYEEDTHEEQSRHTDERR
jgi:hypothetical protein